MRVFVYWNLHRGAWSVKALTGPHRGRVIGRAKTVSLSGVAFKVSEAGRQRVLREGRKNVHAGAVGELTGADWLDFGSAGDVWPRWFGCPDLTGLGEMVAISYNPRKGPTFYRLEDHAPAYVAARAVLGSTGGREVHAYGFGIERFGS